MKWVGEACRRAMIGQLQNVISQSEPRELKMIAIKCFYWRTINQIVNKQLLSIMHIILKYAFRILLKMIQMNIISQNISIGPNFEQIVPHNSIYNKKKKKYAFFFSFSSFSLLFFIFVNVIRFLKMIEKKYHASVIIDIFADTSNKIM